MAKKKNLVRINPNESKRIGQCVIENCTERSKIPGSSLCCAHYLKYITPEQDQKLTLTYFQAMSVKTSNEPDYAFPWSLGSFGRKNCWE